MSSDHNRSIIDASRGFLYFALGAALAIGLGTFGLAFFADNIISFAIATLVGLVTAVAVCVVLLLFRDQILRSIAGSAETNLSALAKPARAITEHLAVRSTTEKS